MNELIIGNQLTPTAAMRLANFERMVKEIKEQEEALKDAIKKEMEARGIARLETDEVTISYIAPTDAEYFDKAKFRKENPDLHDQYITMKPRAAYIKITIKGE